jgi:hypothetical protein
VRSYAFEAKQYYRRDVWRAIDQRIKKPRALRTVAYLDTAEALETQWLLSLGYHPDRLLAVNRSPAQVAALQQRLDRLHLPRVKTAGREWRAVMTGNDVPRKLGVQDLDVINFDGTQNLSADMLTDAGASLFRGPKVLAVTILGAREPTAFTKALKGMKPFDAGGGYRTGNNQMRNQTHAMRVVATLSLISRFMAESAGVPCLVHFTWATWGVYRSVSRQPIVWMVTEVHDHEAAPAVIRQGGLLPVPECFRRGRFGCQR